ncbi:MAG: dehydrogenase E1 component subunit alpha/beta [Bryobacteraceae bacterium]|nr:dehydrogenase E1 component subunit alpha/beta [Bryobacteraceae bacterium]
MASFLSAPAAGLDLKALCRALLLPRVIEEKMLRLIRQSRLSKWFSGYGQEAIAVGCAWALRPEDYILPTHRNLGVWTTRGVPLKPLFCQLMGRQGGFTRGRDRTFHFGLPDARVIGMISHMAAMLPVAGGLALAARLKREPFVALAFAGEGATREGDFHEALNLAAVWKLPAIFVVENNGYALSTPLDEEMAVPDVAAAAPGYGMPGEVIDGNDVFAVIDAVDRAAGRARRGDGPTLLEAKTFRMRGHEEASGTRYVPPELIDAWAKKDPVDRFLRRVLEEGALEQSELDRIREELAALVEDAAEYALAQPHVSGDAETERRDVFVPARPAPPAPAGAETEKRFIDAISDGLRQAMDRDERVLIMGQDIAGYGGVFKVTEGFLAQFGADRVRNTPLIESGILGAAMGLALEGFKPVVEMQYGDFITCGFNQVVNNLATTRYRWGAPLPVVIRAPFGGSIGAGPFHSQSMEAWFCHVPGLKVVAPSTPRDAKGLLMASIEDHNPVLFFEHKYLYRAVKGLVADAPFEFELGRARLAREGTDATIVTYGIGVLWALEEAEHQRERGVSIEVIDLRTLIPWDKEMVLASVAKTNRLLALHEAPMTGGFGAEIAARVAEDAFASLDAPPVRVAGEDFPIPFSPELEKRAYSARSRLRAALDRLLEY